MRMLSPVEMLEAIQKENGKIPEGEWKAARLEQAAEEAFFKLTGKRNYGKGD